MKVLLLFPVLVAFSQKPGLQPVNKPLEGLFQELESEDNKVRRSAWNELLALAKKEGKALDFLIKKVDTGSEDAILLLGNLGARAEKAIPKLAALASDEKAMMELRQKAAYGLGMIGEKSLPVLKKLLATSKEPRVRARTISGLGHIRTPEALELLVETLKDTDADVRFSVMEHLQDFAKSSKARLTAGLKHQNDFVRVGCADALISSGLKSKEAVAVLIELLPHPNVEIRRSAAFAFRYAGSFAKEAVPALAKALEDKDRETRGHAASSLAEMGPDAKAATPGLILCLSDKSQHMRLCATWAIGSIGKEAKAAVPALIELLKAEKHEEVLTSAVDALANMGPDAKEAIPALKAALKTDLDYLSAEYYLSIERALRKIQGKR